MTWRLFIFILIITYGAFSYFSKKSNHQFEISAISADGVIQFNGYQIHPLEPFEIQARVLSSKSYRWDREADLVPVDLALGWGVMADLSVSNQFSITQSNRWYRWRADQLPIARREIEQNSANMHLIPATPEIAAAIKAADVGQMIKFSGDLVEVVSQDKRWRWKSSLTRNDTGAGACELVLVKSFTLL